MTLVVAIGTFISLTAGTYLFIQHRIHRSTVLMWGVTLLGVAYLRPVILLLVSGALVGVVVHEGIHYVLARVWMAPDSVHLNLREQYVGYDDPYEVPAWAMRIIGGAPYIVLCSLAVFYWSAFGSPVPVVRGSVNSPIENAFVGFLIGAGIIISASDALAILWPRTFQEWAANTIGSGGTEARTLLKQKFREDLL